MPTQVLGPNYMETQYTDGVIFSMSALGLLFAGFTTRQILNYKMDKSKVKIQKFTPEELQKIKEEKAAMIVDNESGTGGIDIPQTPEECFNLMEQIATTIQEGAITFLKQEYLYLTYFCIFFGLIVYFCAETSWVPFTTGAFLIGAFTSMACGYIGMLIAVATNYRTTYACNISIDDGFHVAFKGGMVLGFSLVSLALLVLYCLILLYTATYLPSSYTNNGQVIDLHKELFEAIAGYGLGGSTVALFGRVGGGIYTKAADVGADLAGKVCEGLDEDSPKNPGTIADNVGDNVGDIAGMGADLFGSLAESTCAALVVSAGSMDLLTTKDAMFFPLIVTAIGIFASFISQFFVHWGVVTKDNVESRLKGQLLVSSVIMSIAIIPAIYVLPANANVTFAGATYDITPWIMYGCIMVGLWTGLIIGYVTEYYTSNKYAPVIGLVESCRLGAAPNIILGLALGYMSTIIPIICIAITVYFCFHFAGMYGVACGAIGMLGCLPIALTIDGYGPISDNAGGISEMAYISEDVREQTDKLDAAGNTTAAIGKGFAIGSACLVSLALFGAYIDRVESYSHNSNFVVNVLEPITFAGLIIGAMMPYAFSALTMSAVGTAAMEMIDEIKRQFDDMKKKGTNPDCNRCVAISTKASLKMMIAPGALVLFTPFLTGLFFSKDCLSGLLAGAIVSGIQIAFSFSNTGGAWDNCKKLVEEGSYKSKDTKYAQGNDSLDAFTFKKKGPDGKSTEEHKAAVIGDTVGDPLKDTSGPSINILMKLSAITSLVFGSFVAEYGGLIIKA